MARNKTFGSEARLDLFFFFGTEPISRDHHHGDFAKPILGKPTNTIRSLAKQVPRGWAAVESLSFDSGDPTGKWKVEIFVNGKLQKGQTFSVTPQ